MRRGATAAMAIAAFALADAAAESSLEASRASTSIDFQVVIPAFARVRMETPPPSLSVGAVAAARSEVEHADALRLVCNRHAAVSLRFAYDSAVVRRMDVVIGETSHPVEGGFGTAYVDLGSFVGTRSVPVIYRLHLAPGLPPGRYAWPVAIQVEAEAP